MISYVFVIGKVPMNKHPILMFTVQRTSFNSHKRTPVKCTQKHTDWCYTPQDPEQVASDINSRLVYALPHTVFTHKHQGVLR